MTGSNLFPLGDASLTTIGNMILPLLVALFTIWWIRTIIRVVRDSHARSDRRSFHILSVVLVVLTTPIIGLPLYRLIRPRHYKTPQEDRQRALISMTKKCKKCSYFNRAKAQYCQDCGAGLDKNCRECKKDYPQSQNYCMHCGAPNI